MPKYTLKTTEQSIIWPAKCVVCGEKTTKTGASECNITKNIKYKFLWWEHNYASMSITYPICNRHKYIYWFPAYFSKRSLFNLGLSIIIILIVAFYILGIAISVVREIDISSGENALLGLLSFILSIGLVYYIINLIIKLTPVKLLSFNDWCIVVFINNESYAQEFKKANINIISEK